MKLNLLSCGLLLCLFASASAKAEPKTIFELEPNGATYLEVDLGREIYRYSQDSNLRDLMVLDTDGRELPSRIISLQPELTETTTAFPLSFFPVLAGEDPSHWLSRRGAELRIDEGAVSLRLDPDRRMHNAPVEFYIVDISTLKQSLDMLEVQWLADDMTRVMAVEVSASRDLQQWTGIAQATLAQLHKEGESLLRNTVKLSLKPEQYHYLRLRFNNDAVAKVENLNGQHIVQQIEGPAPQRWQLSGVVADDQRPVRPDRNVSAPGKRSPIAAWEFQRNDWAPASRVSIALGDLSYGERVRLYSRNNLRESWQLRYSGIWFNAKVGGEWQQSEAITLRANSDSFWRLELSGGGELTDPGLVFELPQQRLQFIANNNPSYSIAINDEAPAQRTADQVFTRVLDGREVSWQAVGKQALDGAKPIEIRTGFNWQALLFWSVLGLAVIVLLIFALRLVRQMGNAH